MRQVAGYLILVAVFGAIMGALWMAHGWWAFVALGIALALAWLIVLGVKLTVD